MTIEATKAPPAELTRRAKSGSAYVLRLATAYLILPHGTEDRLGYATRVQKALDEDPRVTLSTAPDVDADWSPELVVYTPLEEGENIAASQALEGTRHVHVQAFSDAIAFQLHVPAKNQPKISEHDRIPSEDYFVLWDGVNLLVGWEQAAGAYVGLSGGHTVEEVLDQATKRAGAGLEIQACNPDCTYVFLHTAIRAVVDPELTTDWHIHLSEDSTQLMEAVIGDEDDSLVDVCFAVWYRVWVPLRRFGDMKNRGRQILELEHIVRSDLDGLNRLHHQRASASHNGGIERLRAFWTYRAWRRTSRYYLARLWLGLGTLERLRRLWRDDALGFRRAADEENLQDLFTVDTYDEISMVEELDLGLVEAAIEHAEDRISANILALATAGGAIAGAVVAAILSLA